MRYFALITFLLCVCGCMTIDPRIDPRNARPRLLNTAAVPRVQAIQSTGTLPAPAQYVAHCILTGSGAEWSLLPFATNYTFTVYSATNLMTPTNQWLASYPPLQNKNFWLTSSAPVLYFDASFQPKAQPGI